MPSKNLGIKNYSVYIPTLRLDRKDILNAVGWIDPSQQAHRKGQRAVCDFDEDTITMAVEAARLAVSTNTVKNISACILGSTTLPFADRLNASIVTTALGLDDNTEAFDVTGSQRAGLSAMRLAANLAGQSISAATDDSDVLCVAVDQRRGKPGSAIELVCGDGAAALVLGQEDVIARILAHKVSTIDFVDHFRRSDQRFDYLWEQRWIREEGYFKLVEPVVHSVLNEAKINADEISHFILPCPIARVREKLAKRLGIKPEAIRDNFQKTFGETGAAHSLVMLCDTLDVAKPGDKILVAGFGQGCETFILEVTPLIKKRHATRPVSLESEENDHLIPYVKYLAINELMQTDFGPRSETDSKTAVSTAHRHSKQIGRLIAGECSVCGTIQFPKSAICVNPNCNHEGPQSEHPLADEMAKIKSITTDYLGFSRSPPNRYGMVEFTSGARMIVNFSSRGDLEPAVGTDVNMVYRIKDVDPLRNYQRYCWKALPVRTKNKGENS